jgi:hypothetical protein
VVSFSSAKTLTHSENARLEVMLVDCLASIIFADRVASTDNVTRDNSVLPQQ